MMYRIVWKKHGQPYTEEKDLAGIKQIIDFLERNIDNGFELVMVEPVIE